MKCYSYIRFSKKEQADGRSYDRQLEAARNFANEKGWELDETLHLYDAGKSGFHGEHISTKGKLGEFLRLVEVGEIPVPSALLVENLDRLSRGAIPDALTQFLNLIRAGITVVTLMDRQIFDNESISKDMGQLMISIAIMSRAYEESKTKQLRRGDVWRKGRENAKHGKKIRARCAGWLKFDKEQEDFVEIPERVEIVQRIYNMYVEGHGLAAICKELNKEKVPPFQKGTKGWGTTTVRRILSTRTVLGEMQFKHTSKVVDGSRMHEDIGDPIPDYYPQVIDDKLFYKAQEQMELRKCDWGKVGPRNNLFKGVVKCGYCGATMQYATRGRNKHKYLSCRESRRNICDAGGVISFRYDHLEEVFLRHCQKLKLPDVVKDDVTEHERKIQELEAELLAVTAKLSESQDKAKNLGIAISANAGGTEDSIRQLVSLLNQETDHQREYVSTQDDLKRNISRLKMVHRQTETSIATLKQSIARVENATGDEREEIRRKLQSVIRQLVDTVQVFPRGPEYAKYKERLDRVDIDTLPKEEQELLKSKCYKRATVNRTVSVKFRGGGFLSFMHDHDTEGLKVMLEVEPPDDENSFGKVVRSGLKKITKK